MANFEYDLGQSFRPFGSSDCRFLGTTERDFHIQSPEITIRQAGLVQVTLDRIPNDPQVLENLALFDPLKIFASPVPLRGLNPQQQARFGLLDISLIEEDLNIEHGPQLRSAVLAGHHPLYSENGRLFQLRGYKVPKYLIMDPFSLGQIGALRMVITAE